MKKETMLSDGFWSAVKRKDMIDMLKIIFDDSGEDEAVVIVSETSRMTNAAIDRIKDALSSKQEDQEVEDQEVEDQEAPIQAPNKLIDLEKKVKQYLHSGKYKKAKKALKALQETGIDGSEIKKLKKQLKKIKKDS